VEEGGGADVRLGGLIRVTLSHEMRRAVILAALLALIGSTVATADAGAIGPRARAMKLRLKPFMSCQRLVKYARHNVKRELRYPAGPAVPPAAPPPFAQAPQGVGGSTNGGQGTSSGPEAAPPPSPGSDSSQTNVQEAGVDEPDFVKSDGTHLFVVSGNHLNAVDARAATPKLLGSLKLGDQYGGEMLLYGKRLLIFSFALSPVEPMPAPPVQNGDGTGVSSEPSYYRQATQITEVDVSDPADMRIARTETVDGTYVSARLNGSTARIVLTTPPSGIDYGSARAGLRSKARGWLPRASFENKVTGAKRTRQLTPCRQVRRPNRFAGLDVLTVLTVDMKKGLPAVDTDALMTDGQTVYASDNGLYVATERFVPPPAGADQRPPPVTTAIHRFDISTAGKTAYSSTGEVPGYVVGQFALSEYKGVLRVATTDSPIWWEGADLPQPQSYVSTLKEAGNVLLPLGRVGGIGAGEQIQGVRFLGDDGYVVTFHQTDPLFTIDLSKPAEPRVAGELKLLGFSAYLHPVGDGLLLGIGQDATEQGAQLGTQLSLFDVSDLAHPQRLAARRVGSRSSSEAEYDHHAFLYWAPTKLAVLPVNSYDGSFNGAIGFHVTSTKIEEAGRIEHPGDYSPSIRRALVVGNRLFTISDVGVKSSTLSSLADEDFVPFPDPPQQYLPPGGGAPAPGGAVSPGAARPPG
jgi:hypothetical protein